MSHRARTKKILPLNTEAQQLLEASKILTDFIAQQSKKEGQTVEMQIRINGSSDVKKVIVPLLAIRLLSNALQEMAKGNIVVVRSIPHELTTQQAADLLQVSRPYIVKLLREGKIPFRTVGRYRRISYRGLQEYKAGTEERF